MELLLREAFVQNRRRYNMPSTGRVRLARPFSEQKAQKLIRLAFDAYAGISWNDIVSIRVNAVASE